MSPTHFGKIWDRGPRLKGYVRWELIDDATGKKVSGGHSNVVVDTARNKMADWLIGTAITVPQWIGIGTGTNVAAAGNTALQTPVNYDGVNNAKVASSRTLRGLYTARVVTQFTTTEANQNIRELGLFDAANGGNLWARVNVTINKDNTKRLNVYWYILFERRGNLAIKTGASIGATGTVTQNVDSTLTFASAVTIVTITNLNGARIYFKLNEATSGGPPPTAYDYYLDDQETWQQTEEEVQINNIHFFTAGATIVMPSNALVVRGW